MTILGLWGDPLIYPANTTAAKDQGYFYSYKIFNYQSSY
ncbi:hypothetical protein NIES73_46580 [Sphaerospermopsis kisseleviana NIES-73]|jgi:hypothetical protein|nr:hypothetical protein NIES73_46580 [Sphaerospermopsis kisseleviana NIES-73]